MSFQPRAGWERGYRVTVDPYLEDLAGNSLRRVFDRDLGRPEDAPGRLDAFTIDFLYRPEEGQPWPELSRRRSTFVR